MWNHCLTHHRPRFHREVVFGGWRPRGEALGKKEVPGLGSGKSGDSGRGRRVRSRGPSCRPAAPAAQMGKARTGTWRTEIRPRPKAANRPSRFASLQTLFPRQRVGARDSAPRATSICTVSFAAARYSSGRPGRRRRGGGRGPRGAALGREQRRRASAPRPRAFASHRIAAPFVRCR